MGTCINDADHSDGGGASKTVIQEKQWNIQCDFTRRHGHLL